MSEKFAYVKDCYAYGFWKEAQVKKAVIKGWITAGEYERITGKSYINE